MNFTDSKNFFSELQTSFLYPQIFDNLEYVWEALKTKEEILSGLKTAINRGKVDQTVIIRGPVFIGENTVIEPFTVIDGPIIIGSNCYIRPNAYLRKGSIISNNVVVGHGVEVKNSLIFSDCKIDSHSFIGDSILGRGVRNGTGTVTANRRFDQKDISVKIDDVKTETGFDKFGCVIGDYSRIGANCTILPGTLIGAHVWVYPHLEINGFIPSRKFVKTKEEITDKSEVILSATDKKGEL